LSNCLYVQQKNHSFVNIGMVTADIEGECAREAQEKVVFAPVEPSVSYPRWASKLF
jgi:hypothetical protein